MKKYLFPLNRRAFIAHSAGLLALTGLKPGSALADAQRAKPITVQQIIALILKEGKLSPIKNTVDTLKSGHGDRAVSGIVTTMFPTIDVIEKAARLKANFIIAHEPTFYNHLDKPDWVENNSVVQEKQQLLEKYGITVWRFHDYIHQLKPDAITYGLVKKAGWLPYYKGEPVFTIPSLPFSELVRHLKSSLGIAHVRIIGDLSQPCARVALLPGAWGGVEQVGIAERDRPDVLIVGEVSEWETAEYIRDARWLGRKVAMIVLGHAVSEEPGMAYFVDWLQPKLPDLKITHLASGDPFVWM